MANEHSIRRFRSCYATLLRLYPKRYRERFKEPMEQTFNDLLRARVEEKKGLFGFALWMFAETFAGAVRENMTVIITQNKSVVRIALATAFILLLPLLAMQLTDEVAWDLADFAVAGVLLFGAGLTYQFLAKKAGTFAYRAAVGVAVAAALLLVWTNLAVGIIGSAGNSANLMYIGVLAVGLVGAILARFKPRGMSLALVATAVAQTLVAVIALTIGLGDTIVVTGIFVALWLISAWLFRKSSEEAPRPA